MFVSVSSLVVGSLLATTALTQQLGDEIDVLSAKGLLNLEAWNEAHPPTGYCDTKNPAVRREWSSLSLSERRAYIDAVLCLQKLPALTPPSLMPGAKTRFDDFVGTHINQTLRIHSTGNFLGWHRYFVWSYESALRRECGYTGHQPYWNWGKHALDPAHSPLFDGSDYSLSGDGAHVDYPGTSVFGAPPPYDIIKPGNGGGCVTTGPFKDMVVSLGPFAVTVPGVPPNPQADGLGYNPRCLRRDISENAAVSTRTNATVALLTQHDDVYWFQTYMQGVFAEGQIGVHGGGHFTVGGDPGGDFFTSPGDPAFWLHHAQIDRVWWIWQNLDLETRREAMVGGTIMFGGGVNATMDDEQYFGVNGGTVRLGDLMSTTGGLGGEFCYIYV